jgi:flagellar biosynthesis protein FlhA
LAIDSGQTRLDIDGEETKDPAFGLPAKWISGNDRQRAELGGFTVVDAASVLMTHLGEVLRRYAHELLSREDLQKLLDKTRETAPATVEDIRTEIIRIGTLHQVIVFLLEERVPITNFTRILETVAKHAPQVKEPLDLAEKTRAELGRDICDRFKDAGGKVRVIVVEPRLEMALRQSLRDKELSLPPGQLERFVDSLSKELQKGSLDGREVALLTDSKLRRPLKKAIERALPDMAVIAYCEIPSDVLIEPVAMLRADDVMATSSRDRTEAESSRSNDTIVEELLTGLNAA